MNENKYHHVSYSVFPPLESITCPLEGSNSPAKHSVLASQNLVLKIQKLSLWLSWKFMQCLFLNMQTFLLILTFEGKRRIPMLPHLSGECRHCQECCKSFLYWNQYVTSKTDKKYYLFKMKKYAEHIMSLCQKE